ncbi:MAG: FKBP-type peptidyl-prolyl cis-trans isomerase [Bacteroidetes bacterium]|nr:FKBP-type peptidyl-prolyl cis-trans isomerase [Bacteroidota bacterium]
MKYMLYLTAFTALVSCELKGVDDGEETGTTDSVKVTVGENVVLDENGRMLSDSVNGVPNQMVYNGEKGLRIEWTKKNTTAQQIRLNDVVMINYHARVAGGEEYDSNDPIGEPVPVKTNIGMLIEGWEKGLLFMHKGDKGRIMIPNAMAYGEDGYLDKVPPKADIIVDIEIIDIITPIVLEEGVKVYKWKTSDTGKTPEKNQLITFDYFAFIKGEDGHLYDNSFKNGVSFSFKFENAGVVDGLHQGMSVMKAGENAYFEIPAKLAYGKKGLLDLVPENSDIVYDVRVVSIE